MQRWFVAVWGFSDRSVPQGWSLDRSISHRCSSAGTASRCAGNAEWLPTRCNWSWRRCFGRHFRRSFRVKRWALRRCSDRRGDCGSHRWFRRTRSHAGPPPNRSGSKHWNSIKRAANRWIRLRGWRSNLYRNCSRRGGQPYGSSKIRVPERRKALRGLVTGFPLIP